MAAAQGGTGTPAAQPVTRASGTEPLIRCYIEAKSAKQMKKLETACRKILAG
ncbi:MAG: hypothetical protein EBS05_17035 [Proteobacteria bacterium]|nr:hypothetical protein [Pseudomonadota bacterium]